MLEARSQIICKIITPMTTLREQETPGSYNKKCILHVWRENTMTYQTNEISHFVIA